ncbi:RabGAP/TBC, partial [Metschnikowia bicuspidata var. bicuspidata NRRL YB-4993]
LLRLKSTDGFPSKYRNLLWLELSGASNKSVPGEFHRLLCLCQESSDPSIRTNVEQINLDVHRTLSSNKFFFDVEKCQPGPHFCKLQNILYAFIVHNPKVGYSQGMNRIVGNLLLATSEGSSQGTVGISEEGVFWMFVGIVEDLLPRYEQLFFFDPNALPFIQNDVSIAVKQHFANLLPQLFGHLNLLRVEIEIIVLGWWLGLFSEILKSLDIWFHVIDGLMLAKNPNVKLCAYSIAIFKLCERELFDLKTTGEVYSYFER